MKLVIVESPHTLFTFSRGLHPRFEGGQVWGKPTKGGIV